MAEIGHNGDKAPARDAVLAGAFSKYLRSVADKAEADAEHKDDKKHCADKGLDLKAADKAAKILAQGPGAVSDFILFNGRVIELLEIGGQPVKKDQIELWPLDDGRTPLDEKAYQDGRRACLFWKDEGDNPHALNTEAGQALVRGYRDGEIERKRVMDLTPSESSELIKGHREAGGDDNSDPFSDSTDWDAAAPTAQAAE